MGPYLSTTALSKTSQAYHPGDLGVNRKITQIAEFL
jgi:hypothetical protein